MTTPIRILIAEDHAIVRKGLRALLTAKPGFEVVGEAADGAAAVRQARALQPDITLMDLVMPGQDGVAAICEIKAENPAACILVLTSFADDDKVLAALRAGAQGYLLKDSTPPELLQAIETVHRGESSLSPAIALKVIQELSRTPAPGPSPVSLTAREAEVLQLVAQGLTNQEIGVRLIVSARTVGHHVSNILAKLHLTNRTQAALYALREGLVDRDEDRKA